MEPERRRSGGTSLDGPSAEGERGSATVLVLGVVAVVLCLTVALAGLARAANLRGAAQAAADLAALAGAQSLVAGGDPCAVAAEVARANGAELESCRPLPGAHVEVSTRKAEARARARAGPVEAWAHVWQARSPPQPGPRSTTAARRSRPPRVHRSYGTVGSG